MHKHDKGARRGVTLTDALAVLAVSILASLLAVPALRSARADARETVCEDHLRVFGTGMHTFANGHADVLPGVNTTGVPILETELLWLQDPNVLQSADLPVQIWDWMTPTISDGLGLPDNRAAAWKQLWTTFRCPQQDEITLFYQGSTPPPDWDNFTPLGGDWPACSYLMPAAYQYWGADFDGTPIGTQQPTGLPINAWTYPQNLNVRIPDDYQSKLNQVGPPATKAYIADGTRYVVDFDPNTGYWIDFDVAPAPTWFGGFASSGAWYSGSTAYGVCTGSTNWDAAPVGDGSYSDGANLSVSYRHGPPASGTPLSGTPDEIDGHGTPPGTAGPGRDRGPDYCDAQHNWGYVNIVAFDGHVERLNDRKSRAIHWWYPTGSVIRDPADGMTTLDPGHVVP